MEDKLNVEAFAPEETTENKISIYSKRAIWGFSIFMTPIFAGVLLMQNLKDVGKKKQAYLALLISLAFTLFTIVVVNSIEAKSNSISYLCNMIGGVVLSEVVFKKHFPNAEEYEYKKIWKPLIIAIALTGLFLACYIYSNENI
ncbi:hypothetical protein [Parabacteroides sp. FAFU027]|uniref:hypothetical protein n=1 Tax=Parabacteroides sp. FAFU027 TaxID=2922715 RepID=UPI001FB01066|nr:hypothetical protein [Parabacteroides sp. FAFU027]